MAILGQLHRVTARPVGLSDEAKTRSNTTPGVANYANVLFDGEEIVTGVLAGMIGTVDNATGLYKACNGTIAEEHPMGLFGLDAAGEQNEFNRAKDHGVMTLVSLGFHEIEIYETFEAANMTSELVYLPGQALYASESGLLTNEVSANAVKIAVVEKAPSTADVTMIIKLIV